MVWALCLLLAYRLRAGVAGVAAAVDACFVPVLYVIGAGGGDAEVVHADAALAIGGDETGGVVWTGHAIAAAAAVDGGFVAVFYVVHAGGDGADACCADAALALVAEGAGLSVVAGAACAAAIDITFAGVFCHVVAFGACAEACNADFRHVAFNHARDALHANARAVANALRTGHASAYELVREDSVCTGISGAVVSVVVGVGVERDLCDIADRVALALDAIAVGL